MAVSVSDGLINEILDELLQGITIRKACAKFGVSSSTFLYRVTTGGNELSGRYARVMEARADVLADETIDIADDESKDPNRARNQIQARQWVTSKTAPKKFGDRIDLNVTQSLDIRAILADARGRLRPISDQQNILDVEVIDIKQLDVPQSTHNESDIDIFS